MRTNIVSKLGSSWRSEFVWPRLLEAPALALRPSRLVIALVAIVVIALIGRLPSLWVKDDAGPAAMAEKMGLAAVQSISSGVVKLDHMEVIRGVSDLLISTPMSVVQAYPWSSLVMIPLMLVVWALAGGAMARSAAVEHSLHRRINWTHSLALSLSKWPSLIGCKVGPLMGAAVLLLGLGGLGWALLSFQFVQVLGAALFGIALIIAAFTAVLLLGYALGMPMLVPAVVCEGTDAIDATQRVCAYVVARPLRLVVFLLVLLVQAVVVTAVLGALAAAITHLAAWSTTMFVGDPTAEALRRAAEGTQPDSQATGSLRTAARIISFWSALPALLVSAYAVSYWFSGGSLLYLCMRQVCDGQDPKELWEPGSPPGAIESPVIENEDDDE